MNDVQLFAVQEAKAKHRGKNKKPRPPKLKLSSESLDREPSQTLKRQASELSPEIRMSGDIQNLPEITKQSDELELDEKLEINRIQPSRFSY